MFRIRTLKRRERVRPPNEEVKEEVEVKPKIVKVNKKIVTMNTGEIKDPQKSLKIKKLIEEEKVLLDRSRSRDDETQSLSHDSTADMSMNSTFYGQMKSQVYKPEETPTSFELNLWEDEVDFIQIGVIEKWLTSPNKSVFSAGLSQIEKASWSQALQLNKYIPMIANLLNKKHVMYKSKISNLLKVIIKNATDHWKGTWRKSSTSSQNCGKKIKSFLKHFYPHFYES